MAEIGRQGLSYFPETGIACEGAVRSILLISKVPMREVRTLAVDAGSRTSVRLAQIILLEKHGAEPVLTRKPADLSAMLYDSDAALIIGDPALRIEPTSLPFECLDLGAEWTALTGLPMVFALWAGRREVIEGPESARYRRAFEASCRFGLEHVPEMCETEGAARGVGAELCTRYFTEYIRYELSARDLEGMREYLKRVALLDRAVVGV